MSEWSVKYASNAHFLFAIKIFIFSTCIFSCKCSKEHKLHSPYRFLILLVLICLKLHSKSCDYLFSFLIFMGVTTLTNVVWRTLCVTLSPPRNLEDPPDFLNDLSENKLCWISFFLSTMSQTYASAESPDSRQNLQIPARILFFSRKRPC